MKNKIFIILFLFSCGSMNAQQQDIDDSLRNIINQQKDDTSEVNALAYLGNQQSDFHSAIKYAQQGLLLAKKLNYKKGEADCLLVYAGVEDDFSHAIQYAIDALNIYEELKDKTGIATAHLIMEDNYWIAGDYKNALFHAFSGEQAAETNNITGSILFSGHHLTPLFLAEIGQTYLLENKLDSAKIFTQKSLDKNELFNGAKWGFPVYLMAYIQTVQGNYKIALENFHSAMFLSIQNGFSRDTLQILSGISTLFQKTNEPDSAIYYAQIVVQHWNNESEIKNLIEALNNLTLAYKLKGKKDSVIKYIELHQTLKDSIFSRDKDRELQNITFNEKLNQQEILSAHVKYKNKVQIYVLASGLFVVLLIAGIFWRNNYHRQKAYTLLQKQKQEIDLQKQKVETTLSELKSTQSQLIQSEKMASLGELAAGIAHEIQNPLNFVNNFSEVNKELIDEASQANEAGNTNEVKEFLSTLKDNEEKIIHHGKRADAIVKGMLQHSRSSIGQKEPTNINAIADEYLRLSYHGLRAKDKDFNATMKTDFDNSIGKINIIPQDIGRVLLNLYNNAFYAVNEKSKQQIQGYEPTISVSTKKINDKVILTVMDNGTGIPQKVIDKIFQPFFTTKPTGQGTGLGLSLSYDIIKAHGGDIRVETKENESSKFIIELPLK